MSVFMKKKNAYKINVSHKIQVTHSIYTVIDQIKRMLKEKIKSLTKINGTGSLCHKL